MSYVDTEQIGKWLDRWKGYLDEDSIMRMKYRIIDIPTADVQEIKHGHWTVHEEWFEDEPKPRMVKACSVCKQSIKSNHDALNFCTNCGATMDEELTEEEKKREEEIKREVLLNVAKYWGQNNE